MVKKVKRVSVLSEAKKYLEQWNTEEKCRFQWGSYRRVRLEADKGRIADELIFRLRYFGCTYRIGANDGRGQKSSFAISAVTIAIAAMAERMRYRNYDTCE